MPDTAAADGFVREQGWIWAKLGYRSWWADERFAGPDDTQTNSNARLGKVVPFNRESGGSVGVKTLETQIVAVPLPRTELSVYFPVWQQMTLEDPTQRIVTTGTGDVRTSLEYQITDPGGDAATAVGTEIKIPTTKNEKALTAIPLSEGQVDIALYQATSWDVLPKLRLSLDTLFRYRMRGTFPGSTQEFKPGNEVEVGLSAGGQPVPTIWLSGGLRGLWSTGWTNITENGRATKSGHRNYQQVEGSLYWSWGRLIGGPAKRFAIDLSASWPFAGWDYPRGVNWAVALAWGGVLGK
ncbi:MAG: hypothetical protein ABEL76_14530 [Bradymonadaceae bacterium]